MGCPTFRSRNAGVFPRAYFHLKIPAPNRCHSEERSDEESTFCIGATHAPWGTIVARGVLSILTPGCPEAFHLFRSPEGTAHVAQAGGPDVKGWHELGAVPFVFKGAGCDPLLRPYFP